MPDEPETFEDVYSALRSETGFQFELPVDPATLPDPETPVRADSGLSVLNGIADLIQALGPLLRILLIIAGILLVMYVLFSVVRAILDRRHGLSDRKRSDTKDDLANVDLRPDEAFSSDLLRRADELAATGDFSGAVRLILHYSFMDMQNRVRDRIGVSLTGREIGELGQMPDTSRDALRRLIRMVERSAFAGEVLTSEDYRTARAEYDQFAQRGDRR